MSRHGHPKNRYAERRQGVSLVPIESPPVGTVLVTTDPYPACPSCASPADACASLIQVMGPVGTVVTLGTVGTCYACYWLGIL